MRKTKATAKLLNKRKNINSMIHTEPTMPNPEIYEQSLSDKEHLEERKREKRRKRQRVLRRITGILLIFCCVYLTFLLYGAINTEFIYDEDGQIIPRPMTVEAISRIEDYNQIAVQYRQARYLYEQVLLLDYRVAAGIEDTLAIAPEYEKMLDSVETLAIQLGAVNISSEYTQTLSMLKQWVEEDIAVYCQNMSRAISQNNEEYAANALEYKDRMYQDFSVITQNLLVSAQSIEGADTKDIAAWSPEGYIEKEVGAYAES